MHTFTIFYTNIWIQTLCKIVPLLLTVYQERESVPRTFCSSEGGIHKTIAVFFSLWEKHWYTPNTKEESKQSVASRELSSEQAKSSAKEFKATNRGVHCALFLDRLRVQLQENRLRLAQKNVLYRHENAPAHFAAVVAAKTFKLIIQLIKYPPLSLGLLHLKNHHFLNLKKWLAKKEFHSIEEKRILNLQYLTNAIIQKTSTKWSSVERSL